MSTATEARSNGLATQQAPPVRQIRVVEDSGPLAYLMDTARFEHMYRIAEAMATASLIPDHLRDKSGDPRRTAANCFLVVNQAMRWGFDPFAVAPETYAVGGKLGFQGKLIAAVVNARAGLKGRLRYQFSGTGDERTVTVSGTFEGESEPQSISLRMKDARTGNDMWKKDPDQKLVYSGSIKWARRYCPEVVLGVLTDDDLERITEVAPLPPAPQRKSLDSLADELLDRKTVTVASVEASPEPPVDFNAELLEAIETEINACAGIRDVDVVLDRYTNPEATLDEEQRAAVTAMCNARREAIRGSRGQRAGQQDLLA